MEGTPDEAVEVTGVAVPDGTTVGVVVIVVVALGSGVSVAIGWGTAVEGIIVGVVEENPVKPDSAVAVISLG
jgi:hypothetical protein